MLDKWTAIILGLGGTVLALVLCRVAVEAGAAVWPAVIIASVLDVAFICWLVWAVRFTKDWR